MLLQLAGVVAGNCREENVGEVIGPGPTEDVNSGWSLISEDVQRPVPKCKMLRSWCMYGAKKANNYFLQQVVGIK